MESGSLLQSQKKTASEPARQRWLHKHMQEADKTRLYLKHLCSLLC